MFYIGTFYKEVEGYYREYYKQVDWKELNIHFSWIDRKDDKIHEEIELLVTGTISEEELLNYPGLKHIIVPYTGLNGLPLDILESKGVQVHNTSAHGHFVAERALGLTLAVMGEIVKTHNRLIKGDWSRRNFDDRLYWNSLFGKKIAIFGYGFIGQKYHELIEPFNGEVGIIAYKNRQYEKTVRQFDSLEAMVSWCDVLMIAAPLNDVTKGIIDKKILRKMSEKVLINVGRGAIVNEEDLFEALNSGTLKGFGCDVWYQYPSKKEPIIQPSKYDLAQFNHVVMTPHNAGFEKTAEYVRLDDVLRQIKNIYA